MQRDQANRVPECEEIAATLMAVQNMWLTCTANNIGCYWSSPEYIQRMNNFLKLEEGQRCLGFLYLGIVKALTAIKVLKQNISKNIIWHI
jgi:nitroreductase